jgi:hypothetical protein
MYVTMNMEEDMNFKRTQHGIDLFFILAALLQAGVIGIIIYGIVYIIQHPEIIGEWVHRLISAF